MVVRVPEEGSVRNHDGGQVFGPEVAVVGEVHAHALDFRQVQADGRQEGLHVFLDCPRQPDAVPVADDGDEVPLVRVQGAHARGGVGLAVFPVREVADHFQADHGFHAYLLRIKFLGVLRAAHLFRAEVGRFLVGIRDEFNGVMGGDALEHASQGQQSGYAAGVVVRSGGASAGVVMSADDDPFGGFAGENGADVDEGALVRRERLVRDRGSRFRQGPGDVLDRPLAWFFS